MTCVYCEKTDQNDNDINEQAHFLLTIDYSLVEAMSLTGLIFVNYLSISCIHSNRLDCFRFYYETHVHPVNGMNVNETVPSA